MVQAWRIRFPKHHTSTHPVPSVCRMAIAKITSKIIKPGESPIMHTLREIFIRQKKALFFLLALFMLGWFFTDVKTIFAGLILGSLLGLYNFWILVRRMERFDRSITEGKGRSSLGTPLRFASGVAAAAIALAMPETFNLIGTVIGLMIPYAWLLIDRILFHAKNP